VQEVFADLISYLGVASISNIDANTFTKPLAQAKARPPCVPPMPWGEARKISSLPELAGRALGGVWRIFARGLLIIDKTCQLKASI
jgi:hypothetical protein